MKLQMNRWPANASDGLQKNDMAKWAFTSLTWRYFEVERIKEVKEDQSSDLRDIAAFPVSFGPA